MGAFQDTELTSFLAAGRVEARRARLAARVDRPGRYALRVAPVAEPGDACGGDVTIADAEADLTAAWWFPDDIEGARDLEPGCHYRAVLERNGETVCEARFRTAPESAAAAPSRWSFGAMSCHQPYEDDGSLHAGSEHMMAAATEILRERDAAFLLMMGDQVYGDYPPPLSLFDDDYFPTIAPEGTASIHDCTRRQIRKLYHERHRQFWGAPCWNDLQSSFASIAIPDDHEVVDNLGSNPAHASESWNRIRAGALEAFYDYQGRRAHSDNRGRFDTGFTWGPAAVYCLDVRSTRYTKDDRTYVYSDEQFDELARFAHEHRDAELFVFVTSIPIGFAHPDLIRVVRAIVPDGSDAHERWADPRCRPDRDRLLRLLHDHAKDNPDQLMLILGGDVHVGGVYTLEFEDGVVIHQLVSSAISNDDTGLVATTAAKAAARTLTKIEPEDGPPIDVELIEGHGDGNPCGALNLGLVDVDRDESGLSVTLNLVSCDNEDGLPVVVFSSPPIRAPSWSR